VLLAIFSNLGTATSRATTTHARGVSLRINEGSDSLKISTQPCKVEPLNNGVDDLFHS
jgi:hypothetical protein